MKKNILIIGSGGREHALAWKLSQSSRLGTLYCAPGNGGTGTVARNVPFSADDIPGLIGFAREQNIDLTIVGPEDPLAAGIVDAFKNEGLSIFGPTKAAAQIESSKVFAKKLMQEEGIPTADYRAFANFEQASEYVRTRALPIVVKASGLALGKGVTVCQSADEAIAALKAAMVDKTFGEAGAEVVIEEYLEGPELTVQAFCDGQTFALFPAAQDHKPAFDGDQGPNTGGMGTIAPVPWLRPLDLKEIAKTIVEPTLAAMQARGMPFTGFLYVGLKMTPQGPKVLEYNARLGDPETQSYMRLLKTDLLDVVEACTTGRLHEQKIEWHRGAATCIVMASGGYPGSYEKGKIIAGLEQAGELPDVVVFHAGTLREAGQVVTAGGRVLGVTATGDDLAVALKKAYAATTLVAFEGSHYRRDIGAKALKPFGH